MSEISKRGHDAERNAKPILESLGYQILMELLNEKDEMERKFGRRPVKVVYVRTGEIKYIGRQPSAEEIQLEKKYAKYNKILGDISIPKCVSSDSFDKFIRKSHKKGERTHSYVDYFCKKGKNYYVFDIKHKLFKQNKNLNNFSVTYWEFLNYNRLQKENKIKVKILIIIEDEKKNGDIEFSTGQTLHIQKNITQTKQLVQLLD